MPCIIFAHTFFGQLTLFNALSGFSVLETVAQEQFSNNFTRDYPGGAGFTRKSLISSLYYPLTIITGLSAQTLQYIMIGIEVITFSSACIYLLLILMKHVKSDKSILSFALIWFIIVIALSGITSKNFSGFSANLFHGQFYGFGDAARLLALAFFMQRRWPLVAASLCLGFVIHPIKAVMLGAFLTAAAAIDWRNSISRTSIFWALFSLVFVAACAYLKFGFGQADNSESIPLAEFAAYTRIFQAHWYPTDNSYFFGPNLLIGSSSFLALMGTAYLALAQINLPRDWTIRFIAGFLTLAAITLAGIWVSYDLTSINLIKISLPRASNLMSLLAPFLIFTAIVVHWNKRTWHWVAYYIIFTAGGFASESILSATLFAIAAFFWMYERRCLHWPIATLASITFFAQLALASQNSEEVNTLKILRDEYSLSLIYGLFFSILASILSTIDRWPTWTRLYLSVKLSRLLGVTTIFLVCASVWAHSHKWLDAAFLEKAAYYKAVQDWAKRNTHNTSLFMVDPCINYGWRDFSHRSSIGTPREWYMTGWLYISKKERFLRGIEIGDTFGLNLRPILPKRGERRDVNSGKVCEMATELYYNPEMSSVRNVADRYNVNYFVFDKHKIDKVVYWPKINPIFENSQYWVIQKDQIPR